MLTPNYIGIRSLSLYRQALFLQRKLYDFSHQLEAHGLKDEAQKVSDAAFEIDVTWRNMEQLAKEMSKKLNLEIDF